MRNAILQADELPRLGSRHTTKLWKIFAADRGMGYFAAAVDGGEIAPAADFHLPRNWLHPGMSISGM